MIPLGDDAEIRLAMLGMVEGNGHPYSWSAIFNGYGATEIAHCPYAAIPAYLNAQPPETLGIPRAHVTHIWTDDPQDASRVAKAALIPHVVEHGEDVIGHVDAVLIATDKGDEHVARCRPFVEAGIPVFVDKPLVDNQSDLQIFNRWVQCGAAILSSSCMRYSREYSAFRNGTSNLGELRFASITTPKSWERYGIHVLEGIYPILGPGFLSARNSGSVGRDIVHFQHQSGADIIAVARQDMLGAFGVLTLCGTTGHAHAAFSNTFFAFKSQLEALIEYLRSGVRPFAWSKTVELMKMVIAGIRSRKEGGREVMLSEIHE